MADGLAGQLVLSCACRMMPAILELSIKKHFTYLLHFWFFSLFSLGSILDKILGSTVWNPTLLLRCKISEGYREKTCMQNRHIPVSSAKIKM